MADGQILLSASQLSPTDRDLLLYRNAAGDGRSWEPHSGSYLHNALEPNPELRFTPAVNSSPPVPRHGEIVGLTSLIRTEAQAGGDTKIPKPGTEKKAAPAQNQPKQPFCRALPAKKQKRKR